MDRSNIIMTGSKKYISVITLCTLCVWLLSCKKYVQVEPPVNQLVSTNVYTDYKSAASVLNGVYSSMAGNGFAGGTSSVGMQQGLAADELRNYSSDENLSKFYRNNLDNTNLYYWAEMYNKIYITNAVLEGIEKSAGIGESAKAQLAGEAKFMRAFLYFYMVNLYGGVPLSLSTDFRVNQSLSRSTEDQVYSQIITDLKEAQLDLANSYVDSYGNPTSDRARPNRSIATALLARVYLYKKDYRNAEIQSSLLIDDSRFKLEMDLDKVFKTTTQEAIWQLQSVVSGYNTFDGYFYVMTSPPGRQFPVAISSQLLGSFETPTDERYRHWVGKFTFGSDTYYYPFKYKVGTNDVNQPITESTVIFRLAEQYLIRAEARAKNGKILGLNSAVSDINVIRNRAGLVGSSATTESEVLDVILKERQVELFSEWGHRWFDLKRLGKLDLVMPTVSPLKGGVWATFKALLPIPQKEIDLDNNLIQNPNYN